MMLSRMSATVLRTTTKMPLSSVLYSRALHSPYAVLGDSPPKENTISSAYEKHNDYPTDPVFDSGLRTYVVSEPDKHSRHYHVPAGAYPTSVPYVNFTATSAPDTNGMQYSSTSGELLAHGKTTSAVPQHLTGVEESSAVRYASAPGEMGARGGSYGGLGLMDKQKTTHDTGRLAERNHPPDSRAAEKFSKNGL